MGAHSLRQIRVAACVPPLMSRGLSGHVQVNLNQAPSYAIGADLSSLPYAEQHGAIFKEHSGHQPTPAAWRSLTHKQPVHAVCISTRDTIEGFRDIGVLPETSIFRWEPAVTGPPRSGGFF